VKPPSPPFLPQPGNPPAVTKQFEYPSSDVSVEGVFADLPRKLSGVLEYDTLVLDALPASKRCTLWFRRKARQIFEISLVRRGGRCLVVVGGLDPDRVMHSIFVCRDHFDHWFGITPQDIQAYEHRRAAGGKK
jgi:hypothetical protein